nr:MAG TPA: hypothetical protein [Caudoviricetes sp.]
MSINAYNQHYYSCRATSIEVYFEYNNSVVYDTGKLINAGSEHGINECKKLSVITKCELEMYSGPLEIRRYSRSDNLVIQGIISFFTGFPLTVYDSHESSAEIKPIKYKKKDTHLIIEDVDYTDDLKRLLSKLEDEPELTITLLDRWRKAIYLKEQSFDADLYYDEATLNFFHIFELFGERFSNELKQKLENNIGNMLDAHFKFFYFNESQVQQMVEQNKKSVSRLLIGDYLNLAIKLKFFLEKYNLLDNHVAFFVDNMIKVRNAVAHGRITYNKNFIWPLSPFYNLAKDSYDNVEFLFLLSAVMISRYIGISCWESEWAEAKAFLMPPNNIIAAFFNAKLDAHDITNEMLCNGNKYNITWKTLFNYYVKNPKQAVREKMETVLKDSFLDTTIDEKISPDLFNISVIFSDSENLEIKNKAIENIKTIIGNRWCGWSSFKDIYSYLEFYSVPLNWYKSFLIEKRYLDCIVSSE